MAKNPPTPSPRGRPPTGDAQTAAERMRRYRQRQRDAGLRAVTRYEPPPRARLSSAQLEDRIIQARSLALHCLVARKVDKDRALLNKAKQRLDYWRRNFDGKPPERLDEWAEIITWPWPALAAFLTDAGHRSTRLRQSSPFEILLTPGERTRIYAAFRPFER